VGKRCGRAEPTEPTAVLSVARGVVGGAGPGVAEAHGLWAAGAWREPGARRACGRATVVQSCSQ
jgi:hypothetical protein